jgi:hypothetical protein
VLARESDRERWQLPQIEFAAPALDNALRYGLGDDDIGVEWQMRPVLLDRAERQAQDRGVRDRARRFLEGQLAQYAGCRTHRATLPANRGPCA